MARCYGARTSERSPYWTDLCAEASILQAASYRALSDRGALAAKLTSPRPKRKKQPLPRHRADRPQRSSQPKRDSGQPPAKTAAPCAWPPCSAAPPSESASEEPPAEASNEPAPKQRWKSALAFAKTQTRDESGPAVFSHQGPDGAWEPYDAARCLEIQAAIDAQGPDGAGGHPARGPVGSGSLRGSTVWKSTFLPSKYRAGVASMAWRTTRRFSTNAVQF